MLFQTQPSFAEMELDTLRRLERNGLNLLFLYLYDSTVEREHDPPDKGLVSYPHPTYYDSASGRQFFL
jgi:hypothetical protein